MNVNGRSCAASGVSTGSARAAPERTRATELTCKPTLAYHAALTRKRDVALDCHVDIYRAISDPTRRAILDELVDRSGQSLFDLCSRLIMKHGISSSRQAISQHLDVLESAGLIRTRREGRSKLHWYVGAPLKAIGERWPISMDDSISHPTEEGTKK
ncbi:MAG: helix-turn-helix transcriptional regulator [Gemmatimonadales bacterium]|nr:helix-turn-helix transcriptional regulator [Gemmatimonadales bacterium]MYG18734.1 helix-turn-helix transcriptional regulator [Gemmatimonadales bacterium]